MTISVFGTQADGQIVHQIALANENLSVTILTRGAIVQVVRLAGLGHSLTLGSNELAAYEGSMKYFGAIVGPVANRIAGATAIIDGKSCVFEANENGNTLHGGYTGTHTQVWNVVDHGPDFVELALNLPDGLGGFTGNRLISARYEIGLNASLSLTLRATTDVQTVMNLANHSYWNLDGTQLADGHKLQVNANQYLQLDHANIPMQIATVADTKIDFRDPRMVGAQSPDRIDNNLCLTGGKTALRQVAKLVGQSGTSLTIETTEPGLQVYDAEHVATAPFKGHAGQPYRPFSGIALEAQGWPDAPNRDDFPSVYLTAGGVYESKTRWHLRRDAK